MRLKGLKILLAAFALAAVAAASAQAASTACSDTSYTPATLKCDTDGSKSADFATGCHEEEPQVVTTPVPCPDQWVNVPAGTPYASQAEVCATKGLQPTRIDGAKCASGEHRPSSGQGVESINYRYGTWGGAEGGGSVAQLVDYTTNYCDHNSGLCSTTHVQALYCWDSGDKRDDDSTDKLVAYACGE
jgi:hypothetical protein